MTAKPLPVKRAPYYRESDGKPMAESDLHQAEMIELKLMLRYNFEERGDVYVSGNNFLYYEEGKPRSVISPDVYVVFGVAPHMRPMYKLWEERKAPSFVMEVTSRETGRKDHGVKKATCARLGIAEYWLYDPEHDYLHPPLQGFELTSAGYVPISPDGAGRIPSRVLEIDLDLDVHGFVRLIDARLDQPLRRFGFHTRGLAIARAEANAMRERTAREAAETEILKLRAEIKRLRGEAPAPGV